MNSEADALMLDREIRKLENTLAATDVQIEELFFLIERREEIRKALAVLRVARLTKNPAIPPEAGQGVGSISILAAQLSDRNQNKRRKWEKIATKSREIGPEI